MKWEFVCAVLVISLQFIHQNTLASTILSRTRRGATQFYAAIQCLQPDAMVLKLYGDYGCFCGVGGRGKQYLDETDRCCLMHDRCYAAAEHSSMENGWFQYLFGPLAVSYSHNCSQGEIQCVRKENSDLSQGLCECDKQASKCFAEARSTYDARLLNIDLEKWCSNSTNASQLLSQLGPMPTIQSPTSSGPGHKDFTTTAEVQDTTTSHSENEARTKDYPAISRSSTNTSFIHSATSSGPGYKDFTSMPTSGIQSRTTSPRENEAITKDYPAISRSSTYTSQLQPVTTVAPATPPVPRFSAAWLFLISLIISFLFFCLRFGSCQVPETDKDAREKSVVT